MVKMYKKYNSNPGLMRKMRKKSENSLKTIKKQEIKIS